MEKICIPFFRRRKFDSLQEAVTCLKKNSYKIGYYKVSMFPDFPSILFETAFLSNIYDYEWFTDKANMEKAMENSKNDSGENKAGE